MNTSESEKADEREIKSAKRMHAKKYAGWTNRGPDVLDLPPPSELFPGTRSRPRGQVFHLEDVERDLKQRYLHKKH